MNPYKVDLLVDCQRDQVEATREVAQATRDVAAAINRAAEGAPRHWNSTEKESTLPYAAALQVL